MGIDIGRRWIGISFVTAAVLAQAGVAAAAPAWCPAPGKLVQGNPESLRNSRGVFSVGDAVLATVYLSCMDPKQLTPADRQLGDTSRAQLTQQLNMTDADWADAAAWTQNSVRSQVVALDVSMLDGKAPWSKADPVEQYAVAQHGMISAGRMPGVVDAAYVVDALGPNLSQSGRLGYVRTCMQSDKPIVWAMCQADLAALDAGKLNDELHADKTHDGYARMTIRLAYDAVHQHAAERADAIKKLIAKDPGYAKLFDIATAQRTAWDARWKAQPDLVTLAAAMDDALVTNSRSASAGCHDKTWDALAKVIATLPAKSFATPRTSTAETYFYWQDVEQHVIGTLLADPTAFLAVQAYANCRAADPGSKPDPLVARFDPRLKRYPGQRGPRTGTQTAIVLANIQFDDRGIKLDEPLFQREWLDASTQVGGGADGVIAALKPADKLTTVEFQQKLVSYVVDANCKQTNRIHSIRGDGSLEYEVDCNGTKTITVDKKPTPQKLNSRYAGALKVGMPVVIEGNYVLAAWPAPGTTTPSVVLGVPVK
jgi:hypothetical protein